MNRSTNYWGHTLITIAALAATFAACMGHELPWWCWGAAIAASFGWITPAVVGQVIGHYLQTLDAARVALPPGYTLPTLPPNPKPAALRGPTWPGGGTPAARDRRETIVPAAPSPPPAGLVGPPDESSRVALPSPGLGGLVELLRALGRVPQLVAVAGVLVVSLAMSGCGAAGANKRADVLGFGLDLLCGARHTIIAAIAPPDTAPAPPTDSADAGAP